MTQRLIRDSGHFVMGLLTSGETGPRYLLARAVIPSLGYAKKFNNGGKRPLLGYTKYKFEITAAILITNILLI
jgi:hypothetical protein